MKTRENFLFLSLDEPLIGDIAWRVKEEGHNVKYYIESDTDGDVADGFVEKTDDWRAEVEWADVIVFDDIWQGSEIGTGRIAQELREEGKAVVGGTAKTDKLEDDRGYAMKILKENGVNVAPHHEFDSFDKGIEFVRENPNPYVIKPLGEVQNVKRLLYVGRDEDGNDIIDVPQSLQEVLGSPNERFPTTGKS